MKNSIFFFLLIFPGSGIFAQQDSISRRDTLPPVDKEIYNNPRLPKQGNTGFSFNFIGFLDTISIGSFKDHIGNEAIMARYYIADNSAIRLGLGFNLDNERISRVDSVGSAQVSRDSTYKRTDFFFSPGFEKHFASGKNLDPYLASAISIGKIGRTKVRDIVTTTDTTGKSLSDITFDMDGGYLVGINLIAGFNYFFSEKISIGAEYGFGVNTARYGGDWTKVTIDTPASGSQTVKREVGSQSVNSTQFRMNSNAGIMLSYFF
jgi:hypothetical protein